jgi:DNA-binding NarL/FixJ family response regulator
LTLENIPPNKSQFCLIIWLNSPKVAKSSRSSERGVIPVSISRCLRVSASVRRRAELLRAARLALGPELTRAAENRGAAMSPATAAQYALLLTTPEPSQVDTPNNPGNLSPRERELVTLVAQGRTDADIAAQLYISIRTVRSHLDRIRDKTGCRRRADLTRLALGEGMV